MRPAQFGALTALDPRPFGAAPLAQMAHAETPAALAAPAAAMVFYGSLAVDERAALESVRPLAAENTLAHRLGCSPLACAFVAALAGTFEAHCGASKMQLAVHVENTNIYLSAYSDAPAGVAPADTIAGLYGCTAAGGPINAFTGALRPAAVQTPDVPEWQRHTFCRLDGAAEVPKLTATMAPTGAGGRASAAHRKAAADVVRGLWDSAYTAFWSVACPPDPVTVQFKLLDEPLMQLVVVPWTTGRRMVASGGSAGPLIVEVTGPACCVACTQFEAGLDGVTDHIMLRNFGGTDKKASAAEAAAAGGFVKWRAQVSAVRAQTFSPSRAAAAAPPPAPRRFAGAAAGGRRTPVVALASDLYEELGLSGGPSSGESGALGGAGLQPIGADADEASETDYTGGGRRKRRMLAGGAAAAGGGSATPRYSPAISPKELGAPFGGTFGSIGAGGRRRTPLMRAPTPSATLVANYELDPMPPAFLDPWLDTFAKAQVSSGSLAGLPAEYKGAIADPPLEQLRLAFPDYAAHREDFEPTASDATAIRVVNAITAFVISALRANGARSLVPERWTTGFFSEKPSGLFAGRASVTTAEFMATGDTIWPAVAAGGFPISGSRVHRACELFELARANETDGAPVAVLGFNLGHPIWTNLSQISVCCRIKPAVAHAVISMVGTLAGGADLGSAATATVMATLDECNAEKFVTVGNVGPILGVYSALGDHVDSAPPTAAATAAAMAAGQAAVASLAALVGSAAPAAGAAALPAGLPSPGSYPAAVAAAAALPAWRPPTGITLAGLGIHGAVPFSAGPVSPGSKVPGASSVKICWDIIESEFGFPEANPDVDPEAKAEYLSTIGKQLRSRTWAAPKTGTGRGGNQKDPRKSKLPCMLQAIREAADNGVTKADLHALLESVGAFVTSHTKTKLFRGTGASAAAALSSLGGLPVASAMSAAMTSGGAAAPAASASSGLSSLSALFQSGYAAAPATGYAAPPTPSSMSAAGSLAALLMSGGSGTAELAALAGGSGGPAAAAGGSFDDDEMAGADV